MDRLQYSIYLCRCYDTLRRDGGEYSCTATNTVGSTTHTDTLRVYGPPVSRGQVGEEDYGNWPTWQLIYKYFQTLSISRFSKVIFPG